MCVVHCWTKAQWQLSTKRAFALPTGHAAQELEIPLTQICLSHSPWLSEKTLSISVQAESSELIHMQCRRTTSHVQTQP